MIRFAHVAALSALTLATFTFTGCKRGPDFASAVPKQGQVKMNVPAASEGQALLVGETSGLYVTTLAIASTINGATLGTFAILEAVVRSQPTTQTENEAVWGPTQPEGLEPLSHQLTVTLVEEGHYTYKLEARRKDDTGPFTVVFEGEAFPGDDDKGTGSAVWHLGSQRNLVVSQCALVGDIAIDYDATSEPRVLNVDFIQVADECKGETPHDARYTYTESADASGTMEFAVDADIHGAADNKPELETLAVVSQWRSDGAGRSDVIVSGGEV